MRRCGAHHVSLSMENTTMAKKKTTKKKTTRKKSTRKKSAQQDTSLHEQLAANSIGVRLSKTRMGTSRSLERTDADRAAHALGAGNNTLKAAKLLVDTKRKEWKACTAVISRAYHYWTATTLPYPDRGVRLMRRVDMDEFAAMMAKYQTDLDEAVAVLDAVWPEMLADARERLGDLFDERDYPRSVVGQFALDFDFPSLEPPSYLADLAPEVYEKECERMQVRFMDAIDMAERAFADELAKLVARLSDRLASGKDGKPQTFRDSTVTNLGEFFDRFRTLSIRSNSDLDELVDRAQTAIAGVDAKSLRESDGMRRKVRESMTQIGDDLESMMVKRSTRAIRFDD